MSVPLALTETYSDAISVIQKTVYRFWRKYGGDIRELMAEANFHFMTAYAKYEQDKGSFDGFVSFIVFKQLLESLRLTTRRRAKLGTQQGLEGLEEQQNTFRMFEFLEELSQDAATVVRVLFELDQPNKGKLRSALNNLGWTANRIAESFQEITNILMEN